MSGEDREAPPGAVPPPPPPPGWWQASDGNWYPPEQQPGYASAPTVGYSFAQPAAPGNGMATASLVLGIVSICLFWTFGFGVVLGIMAIVFGIVGRNQAAKLPDRPFEGRAKGGLVTGIIGVVVGAGFFVLMVFALGEAADDLPFDDFNSDPSDGWCNEDRYWQDPDC